MACVIRPSWAEAQGASPVFGAPQVVRQTAGRVSGPQIVVDAADAVHLFYVETREDGSNPTLFHVDPEAGPPYTPTDVLVGVGTDYRDYRATADPFGNVHVVFRRDNVAWHTRASGSEAGDARAWTTPVSIGGAGPGMAVTIDAAGQIHVCFPSDGAVRHTRSMDGGETWSPDILAAAVLPPAIPVFLACAVDTEGVIHAAWAEAAPPNYYPSIAVSYTRSDDEGLSWDPPERVAGAHYTLPELLADSAGNVHFLWQADVGLGGRKYRVREAGAGRVWSDEEVVIPEGLGGMSGDAPLAVDGDGDVHVVTAASEPVWVGRGAGGWGAAVALSAALADEPNASGSIEYPAFGISGGNVAHVAFEFDFSRIYYVSGLLPAADQRSVPAPAPEWMAWGAEVGAEDVGAVAGEDSSASDGTEDDDGAGAGDGDGDGSPSGPIDRPAVAFGGSEAPLLGDGRGWLRWLGPALALALVAGVMWWRVIHE